VFVLEKIQPVRGTHDLLGGELEKHSYIENCAKQLSYLYGYEEILTPIIEYNEVFTRSLGETSDVISKEMFTIKVDSGNDISLRPEGTASISRAFISNGLAQNLPLKFFYKGPMFRRERPQKGRQRQFHQVGVEYLGDNTPYADVEVISLANSFLKNLDLKGDFCIEINSLGDSESRMLYTNALVEYFTGVKKDLSSDSLIRLKKNPLRILDSKDKGDMALVSKGPILSDYLNSFSNDFYNEVKRGLENLEIKYIENPKLVRGLDYYCHTAFEFTTNELGSQGTVLGGGRYDGLIEGMGGPATSGIGWAAGVERLAMLIEAPKNLNKSISIIYTSDNMLLTAQYYAEKLRHSGLQTNLIYSGSMKKQLKKANKIGSVIAIIFGEDEFKKDNLILRNLKESKQKEIKIENLIKEVKKIL
jgi:histidyl-tRNA synthetase